MHIGGSLPAKRDLLKFILVLAEFVLSYVIHIPSDRRQKGESRVGSSIVRKSESVFRSFVIENRLPRKFPHTTTLRQNIFERFFSYNIHTSLIG